MADDVQSVDEISRRWFRGKDEVAAYAHGLAGVVSNPRTEISDIEEHVWGGTGLVTCWLEQDYTYEATAQHVSAPTTVVLDGSTARGISPSSTRFRSLIGLRGRSSTFVTVL
jgi:hypothetical protein